MNVIVHKYTNRLPIHLVEDVRLINRSPALERSPETLKSLWIVNKRTKFPINNDIWRKLQSEFFEFLGDIYRTALGYVEKYRPKREIDLFKTLFPENDWHQNAARCFISLYEANRRDGVLSHRDWVSFCTVTVCLSEDSCTDSCLILTKNNSIILDSTNHLRVFMEKGDIVTYGRYFHHIPFLERNQDRCTMNFFF